METSKALQAAFVAHVAREVVIRSNYVSHSFREVGINASLHRRQTRLIIVSTVLLDSIFRKNES